MDKKLLIKLLLVAVTVVVLLLRFDISFAVQFGVAESLELHSCLTCDSKDNRGKNRHERLLALLQDWKNSGADFGVIVGDNIDGYQAAADTLIPLLEQQMRDLNMPIYLVLGNHDWVDITTNPNYSYLTTYLQRNFGFSTPWYSFEQDGVTFVFLADDA